MSSAAPPIVHEVLDSTGELLEREVRSQMESSFGHDFSHVRVHNDARAAESASSVNALAYTVGNHIVFASGHYQPQAQTGRRLIAHELAHTIQQGHATTTPQAKLEICESDNEAEREADHIADRAMEHERNLTGPSSVKSERSPEKSALAIDLSVAASSHRQEITLQRQDDGGEPKKEPPEAPKPEGGDKEPATAPAEGSAKPAAPCDPKGLARADYLKEPGTSTNDFGLTSLSGTAQIPVVKTSKTSKGLVLELTDAKLPPLTSVYTAAGKFIEGQVISIGEETECPSGKKYPIQWWILPKGADKIREGELEHCADFQHAFDVSIRRYADVVNDLATKKKVFASQKAAEKYVTGLVGPKPDTWADVFRCLANKTLLRDDPMKWHTPRPVMRPPRLDDDCKFARAIVGESSLSEVGKHSTPDLIKDCNEGPPPAKGSGTGSKAKPPAPKGEAKISLPQTENMIIAGRIVNPASMENGPAPEANSIDFDSAATPATSAAAVAEPSSGLIVEDEATQLTPGQMRKSDFLAQLRQAACAAADAELVRVGRNTESCPYLARAFERYRTMTSSKLERGLRRYAPEAAGATTAAEYITAVSERIKRAVGVWARTGEITDVPDELAGELGGMGIGGLLSGMAGGIGGLLGGLGGGLLGGLGGVFSGLGGMFFKGRTGGVKTPAIAPAQAVENSRSGQTLESSVRQPMERVFGHDFSRVRVHADAQAAALTSGLNARAFTVGENMVFGHGEYRPGTLFGDALIAHELAHVVQQSGSNSRPPEINAKAYDEDSTLEMDADRAAIGAVASVRFGTKAALARIARNSLPRLRSGLGLQRCAATQQRPALPTREVSIAQPGSNRCEASERQSMEQINLCCTQNMIGEIQGLLGQAIPIVENARNRLNTPSEVSDQLWNNFRVRPDDQTRIAQIRLILDSMKNSMEGNRVKYVCSHVSDPACSRIHASTVPTCSPSGDVHIRLCAEYPLLEEDANQRFLPDSHWVRTLIHEHAHAGCPGSGLIFPAGAEFYKDRGTYPREPDRNIKNADCYAWFAMDSR